MKRTKYFSSEFENSDFLSLLISKVEKVKDDFINENIETIDEIENENIQVIYRSYGNSIAVILTLTYYLKNR